MIRAFRPHRKYLSLSVTGTYCELMCINCRGKYLKCMTDVSKPSRLEEVLSRYYEKGVRGFLISGGFNRYGYLMISKEHLGIIKKFKHEYGDGVVISIHLGLAPTSLIDEVWSSGIDYIDYEVPPSNRYIKIVKRLSRSIADYLKNIEYCLGLDKHFIKPHIIIDSTYATSSDEEQVIREISNLTKDFLVILIEIRKGLGHDLERIMRAFRIARRYFKVISLGCMRNPKIKKLVDRKLIDYGLINRIANPKEDIVRSYGLEVIDACCSIPDKYIRLFTMG